MAELQVRVVSPDSVLYDGLASSVVVPAWDGKLGLLPGHAPLIALLGDGELSIDHTGGGSERFFVAGGVLKVERDDVMILTEYAGTEAPEDLPADAAVDVGQILDAMETTG